MSDPLDPDRFSPEVGGGINRAASVGFERGAEVYERARPSYPAGAVDLIVEMLDLRPGRRVLDLAAGTGKLTRLLVPSGVDLVAVEPVAAMRDQLVAAVPGVTVLDGTAEAIPLEDASVDGVVVGQAFHWFAAASALAEIHRVVRPSGSDGSPTRLALVWNQRDEQVDWVRRFGEILVDAAGSKPYVDGTDWSAVVAAAGGWGPLEQRQFAYEQLITGEILIARASSTSFVSALPGAEREQCLEEVRALVRTHPLLEGRGSFAFPYVTHVFWCDRA